MSSLTCRAQKKDNKQLTITNFFAPDRRKRRNLTYDEENGSILHCEKKLKLTFGSTSFEEISFDAQKQKQVENGLAAGTEHESQKSSPLKMCEANTNERSSEHEDTVHPAMKSNSNTYDTDGEINVSTDAVDLTDAGIPCDSEPVDTSGKKITFNPCVRVLQHSPTNAASNGSTEKRSKNHKTVQSSKKMISRSPPERSKNAAPAVSKKDTERRLATLSINATAKPFASPSSQYMRKNIEFYSNKVACTPNGAKIEDLLQTWKGDYRKLERHHGYIQWLFPIPVQGLNSQAQPLTPEEAVFLHSNDAARERLMRSYSLMLDFFGMELQGDENYTLRRAKNWKERYANLNSSHHNFLRITRILKCLHEVGLLTVQLRFVEFLVHEVYVQKGLTSGRRSCSEFWVPTIANVQIRNELETLIKSLSK